MLGLSQLLLSFGFLWFVHRFGPEPSATNLTGTLPLSGDGSAIHPTDELNFDIRKQHKDSDTQRRNSNGCQRLT